MVSMKIFKDIGSYIILMLIGCALLAYGLFVLYGLGVSLSVIGAIFFCLGVFGEFAPIFINKG
jgi:hypothetical protein